MLEITDENLEAEVLKSDVPVVVDVWAEWCAPCRLLAPIYTKVADSYSDGSVKFVKANADDNHNVITKFTVGSSPTILLVKNGEVVKKLVGLVNEKALRENVEALK